MAVQAQCISSEISVKIACRGFKRPWLIQSRSVMGGWRDFGCGGNICNGSNSLQCLWEQ